MTVDDTARFLAGMQPSADSPLMPLTRDPAWQHHARFFDAAFAQLEQRQLVEDTGLVGGQSGGAAADHVLHVLRTGLPLRRRVLLRRPTTYVLSALEPPGGVPDLTRLPRGSVDAALYNIEHSLSSILNFSFFITKHMKVDLREGQISGTLPILYVFLARSGKTIRSVTSDHA